MPEDVRMVFDLVGKDVRDLHAAWATYLDLFAEQPLAVVNRAAPSAFSLIEASIRHFLVMAFGRVTDSADFGREKNLSLLRLCEVIRPHAPVFCDELLKDVASVRVKAEPIKTLRLKTVAHRVEQMALQNAATSIPGGMQKLVSELAIAIAGVMNDVERHFEGGTTCYAEPIMRGTGKDIVAVLRLGLEARVARRRHSGDED